MTSVRPSDHSSHLHGEPEPAESAHPELEEYAGGSIRAHHGYIPIWLLVVYFVLFAWGLYYAYHFWGGLGPGRI